MSNQPMSPIERDGSSRRLAVVPTLPPLPVPLTSFIGRDDVVAAVVERLRQSEVRLMTLTGPGGVGKTRIAIAAAGELREAFRADIGFVGLSGVRDPALVLPTIAHGLGIQEGDHQSLMERVAASLSGRHVLLVLDNFEQVAPAGPKLTELLGSCLGITLLVTSRAPLRVSGEHVFPIPPLTLPARGTEAEVVDAEAVRLFLARAGDIRPDVTLTEATSPAIAEICMRLDGLPLAIELAAARSSLLAPPAMLARLDHRLPMLTSGHRDQPARLQTMRDAIAWSYDLLSNAEQALFRRLSVFVDGFSLDAAIAVGNAPDDATFAGLEALVDQSLVQAMVEPADEPRYTMLETIREYGLDRLAAAGESDKAHRRHARYFVTIAERIEPEIDGPEGSAWLPLLDLDRANLHVALTGLIHQGETEDALRLAAALWRYWRIRGSLSEGRDGLTRALALPGAVSPSLRANALWKLGYMLFYLGEYDAARDYLEQSVALFTADGNRAGEATAQDSLGTAWLLLRDRPRARACHERALAVRQELGERSETQVTLANLGMLALLDGDFVGARALLTEALIIARESGSRREIANRRLNLGRLEFAEGNVPAARELVDSSLATFEEVGDQPAIAETLEVSGQIASALGEHTRGIDHFLESLRLRMKLGLLRHLPEFMERLAWATVPLDAALAVRLMAAVASHRGSRDAPRAAWDQAAWDRAVATAQGTLGGDGFTAAWQAGQGLTLIAACQEAMALLESRTTPDIVPERSVPPPSTALAPGVDHGLTPREVEILRLVAAGRTNREIGEALYISPATAKRHVTNILAKLRVSSRAGAISFAHRAGLIGE